MTNAVLEAVSPEDGPLGMVGVEIVCGRIGELTAMVESEDHSESIVSSLTQRAWTLML